MIHILFERTGGFMGRKVSFDLALNDLPPAQAEKIKQLIEESDFFNIAEPPAVPSKPDEFSYAITIDTGTIAQTIHATDTSIPEVLRPLVNELVAYSRNIGKNI